MEAEGAEMRIGLFFYVVGLGLSILPVALDLDLRLTQTLFTLSLQLTSVALIYRMDGEE